MNSIKIYFIILLSTGLIALSSCSKFDQINTDTNATESVTASMIATNLLVSTMQDSGNKYFCYHNMASKHIVWTEFAENYQYNKFERSSFDIYSTLRNCNKMVESSTDLYLDSFTGLATFLKAFHLFYLSLELGDIPYSEALLADDGITTPKYDSQKELFIAILDDLDKANELFSTAESFDGDPIYGGDPLKWQKCVNSFQLKVLINLSNKIDDSSLQIKERFADVMTRDIFTSNSDNYQLVYSDTGGQSYPFNINNSSHATYGVLSNVLVDPLKELEDYRLFAFANPTVIAIASGLSADSFDAYVGPDPSESFDLIRSEANSGNYCKLNDRYIYNPAGEPVMKIGYAEVNFIIAEAINRGIYDGDINTYYNEGIRAAMSFVADNTPDEYNNGRQITTDYIDQYIASSKVALSSVSQTQLEQIMLQKYFTTLLQNKWDSYFDYRRTGLPELPINPETNMNQIATTIPTRWTYPESEYDDNADNLAAALSSQYDGRDDNNDLMWILE